jgi:hypothetical protein
MPWEGGLALDGSPDIKPPGGLSIAEDVVFDHAGAKHRRGGQQHLHRHPIREGTAFEDHFLSPQLSTRRWPEALRVVSANHFISSFRRSTVRVSQRTGTTAGTTTISSLVKGTNIPENKMKYLVTTLSSDVREAETQSTLISIQWQVKGDAWPVYDSIKPLENFVGIEVEPGRPGDIFLPEWHFDIRFGAAEMMIRDESGTMVVPTFVAGYDRTELLGHKDVHTWRADIRRTADSGGIRHYVADIYYEGEKVVDSTPIDNDSVAGATFTRLTWDVVTGLAIMDVEFDSIDVQAEIQEIRGIHEFAEDPTDIAGAARKRAIYAGTRIYLDIGNHFYMLAIDDELPRDQLCSFEVFESRIRPLRVDQLRTAQTS